MVIGSLAICLGAGVLGLGHGGPGATAPDTRFLYLAGKYWLAGVNAYAPQAAPLCMVLARGSLRTAVLLMAVLNLAATAVLAWIAVAMVEEAVPPTTSTVQRWYVPALVVGNLSTAFVLWMGQTTLIVAAALAAAWWCVRRGWSIAAVVPLALATIKPPLGNDLLLYARVVLVMAALGWLGALSVAAARSAALGTQPAALAPWGRWFPSTSRMP